MFYNIFIPSLNHPKEILELSISEPKKKVMPRSTKDLIKNLMKKLDLLHTKYVHMWINNQFFENDEYEEYMDMLDEWSIDGYYDSYNWLLRCDETSKEKGRAAESANQVMAEFLSVWKRKAPDVFKEAIEQLAYCAEHEFTAEEHL